ncbi:hypothetical protein D9M70_482940 [compost metagenome]
MKNQLKPAAIVRSRYGDPEAFGERWLEVVADIQAMPYGAKLYAIPEGGVVVSREVLERALRDCMFLPLNETVRCNIDRNSAVRELRAILAQQGREAGNG